MPKTVILVEDDPDDLFFFQRAFSKNIGDKELRVIRNGEDLISYLDQSVTRKEPDEESLPCLILLDMKMPRKSGLEVLEWIRSRPLLRRIPVVVFSSSQSTRDINEAYERGASSYFVKPIDLTAMTGYAELLCRYWLDAVRLPQLSQ